MHDEIVLRLCPELRSILDAELAAGNSIAQSWDTWGLGVLLSRPFIGVYPADGRIRFLPLSDPHYWKAEYTCGELKQTLGCSF